MIFSSILTDTVPLSLFLIFTFYLLLVFLRTFKSKKGKSIVYWFQFSCFFLIVQNIHLGLSCSFKSIVDVKLNFTFSSYSFYLLLQFLSFWGIHISMESVLIFPQNFRKVYKYTSYLILTAFSLALLYMKYAHPSIQNVSIIDIFFVGNRFPLEISNISGIQFLMIFALWILELSFVLYCLNTSFKSPSRQSFNYFLNSFLLQTSLIALKIFSLPPFEDTVFLQLVKYTLFLYYLGSWFTFLKFNRKNLNFIGYLDVKSTDIV